MLASMPDNLSSVSRIHTVELTPSGGHLTSAHTHYGKHTGIYIFMYTFKKIKCIKNRTEARTSGTKL